MIYYYEELQNLDKRINALERKIDRVDADFTYFYNRIYPQVKTSTNRLFFENNELKKAVKMLYGIVLVLVVLNFYFIIG